MKKNRYGVIFTEMSPGIEFSGYGFHAYFQCSTHSGDQKRKQGQNGQFQLQSLRFSFGTKTNLHPTHFCFPPFLFAFLLFHSPAAALPASALPSSPFSIFSFFHFPLWIPMVTTVKSRPPHASFAMSGRRRRSSPAAPSCSSVSG